MKKNLKKVLILLTILVGFIGTSVKAKNLEVGDAYTVSHKREWEINGLNRDNFLAYLDKLYTATGGSNTNITSYCEDPNWEQVTNYRVDRILGAGNITKRVKAHDLGLVEIMKNGQNQYNNSYTTESGVTLTGDELHTATSIALRAYSLGVFGYGKSSIASAKYRNAMIAKFSSYVTKAIDWASLNQTQMNVLTPVCANTGSSFKTCYANKYIKQEKNVTWYDSKYNISANSAAATKVLDGAYSLFKKGLDKAYDVMTDNASSATISGKANNNSADKKTVGNTIEEYYYQTIDFAEFDAEKGKIHNFALTCIDCAKNNITLGELEFYNPQIREYQAARGVDLLTAFDATGKTKSGKIELRFKVSRLKDDENCNSVNYTISYNYSDPSIEYTGAKLSSPTNTKAQRFFIIQKNEGELEDKITGTIKCALSCDTELELPVCSYDEDDAVATIDGPTKIKTCVIGNNDDAGNSYQFTSSAGGVDNAYCKVYCKEDYAEIKLNPIVQDVKCGGYFKLTSKINGTKTCYTGSTTTTDKSIDKEQYLKDIKTVQENLVDAMNRYYEYEAKSKHTKTTSSKSNTCGSYSCGTENTIEVTWKEYSNVTFTWNQTTGNGTYKYGTTAGGNDHWTDNCTCSTCGKDPTYSCCGGCDTNATDSYNTWTSEVNTGLETAKSDLIKYMAQYKQIIQDYNACTTGWTNEFAFAQKLKYYYDENRGENNTNYTPYYDLLQDNEELQYLEKYGTEKVTSTIKICKGNTDVQYQCLSSAVSDKDGSIDNSRIDEYNYNSSYGSDVFDNRNYVICSAESGCQTDVRQISQATFVKKEVTKEQKYITPTSFYQIAANGKVVVRGDYSLDKVQLEPLTNKLPTSTSSVGGGVFKLLVENLGEFYGEKNAYGRLIDFNKANETRSVAYAKGVDVFNGEYVCYYENTCRPKDCPNCDFVCEGDGCEWKECPSCNISCVNCIFNLDDLNVVVKTITTTDVNAANRTHGYNWITSSSLEALQLLNKKASTTISEIEEINEMIYDDKTTDGSTLGFSIKLTPEIINKITAYNKDNEKNGGYINNSLTCYDATIDGETYKNIYCYSELIDKLVDENGDNVTVLPSRVNEESRRAYDTESSGYWTLWSNYRIDKTSESVIGGPSWK